MGVIREETIMLIAGRLVLYCRYYVGFRKILQFNNHLLS